MPRQAFNANTYLHQPLQSLDFPETAYDNNPQLTFTVEPVSERTLRIRMLTSPIVPKEDADDPMLIGKPADGRSFWKAEKTDKGTLYTSRYGSLLIQNYPWRLVLKDADGRLLTQTRAGATTTLRRSRYLHSASSSAARTTHAASIPYSASRRTRKSTVAASPPPH